MAHYTETRTAHFSFGAWLSHAVASLVDAIRTRREIARTYNELNSLSARELDDLGLTRLDIARVAHQSVRG